MTDTELIATKLLGWVAEGRGYYHREYHRSFMVYLDGDGRARIDPTGDWPDFTTLDGCREFELALCDRGLLDYSEHPCSLSRYAGVVECGHLLNGYATIARLLVYP